MTDLTEKQEKFLELIFLPEYVDDYKSAALTAGYSENSKVYDILTEPVIKEIVKRVDHFIAVNTPKSINGILRVMQNPDMKGAKALLEASGMLLDRAGISKKERLDIHHDVVSGVFILPVKKDN